MRRDFALRRADPCGSRGGWRRGLLGSASVEAATGAAAVRPWTYGVDTDRVREVLRPLAYA